MSGGSTPDRRRRPGKAENPVPDASSQASRTAAVVVDRAIAAYRSRPRSARSTLAASAIGRHVSSGARRGRSYQRYCWRPAASGAPCPVGAQPVGGDVHELASARVVRLDGCDHRVHALGAHVHQARVRGSHDPARPPRAGSTRAAASACPAPGSGSSPMSRPSARRGRATLPVVRAAAAGSGASLGLRTWPPAPHGGIVRQGRPHQRSAPGRRGP